MQGIKAPSQTSDVKEVQSVNKTLKALSKVKMLTRFQATLMQAVLQKIDRKCKPIKKQIKVVSESLLKKKIFLD